MQRPPILFLLYQWIEIITTTPHPTALPPSKENEHEPSPQLRSTKSFLSVVQNSQQWP